MKHFEKHLRVLRYAPPTATRPSKCYMTEGLNILSSSKHKELLRFWLIYSVFNAHLKASIMHRWSRQRMLDICGVLQRAGHFFCFCLPLWGKGDRLRWMSSWQSLLQSWLSKGLIRISLFAQSINRAKTDETFWKTLACFALRATDRYAPVKMLYDRGLEHPKFK